MPQIIAPMAGQHPVWMVDGGAGRWLDSGAPVKTVWVLARDQEGALAVEGRRLDGDGALTFRIGLDGPIRDSLWIRDPHGRSMIPGGATPQTMRKYAFVSSYVFYSSPGCWELTIRLGELERRIVLEVLPIG